MRPSPRAVASLAVTFLFVALCCATAIRTPRASAAGPALPPGMAPARHDAGVPSPHNLSGAGTDNSSALTIGPGSFLTSRAPFASLFVGGTPYTGTPINLPGTIQAENFDNGGEGVAYHDTTSTNDGGYYRGEGVDICTCGSPYGYSVGWTIPGEWMEYTVNVTASGTYAIQALTATTGDGTALHVEVDGVNVTGTMTLPNTGAWGAYATTSKGGVYLNAGQHTLRVAVESGGFLIDSVAVVRQEMPYGGTPISVPGTIQAEDFDSGGEGVAYHDTTATNDGGYYRSEGVDLCTCGNPYGSYSVGWTLPGEWTRYTVNVASAGTYRFDALTATMGDGCAIHWEVDGADVTGQMALPNTGAWGAYATTSKSGVRLTAGQHVLRMVVDSGGFLIDSLGVTRQDTPYGGVPAQVPGFVQAEDFDNGGEGVSYHDTTPTNEGGLYRPGEGVDIGGNTAGYSIGWTQPGEWTKYTVNVATTDSYTLQATWSMPGDGGAIHLEVDGVNVTGTMLMTQGGGYGAWRTVSKPGVPITAGQHELKMVIESGGFIIDSFGVIPPAPAAPSALTAAAVSTGRINLAWADNSSNETGFKVERKTGAGGVFAQVATVGAGVTSYSDTGLASNTQYYYRVRATNLGGDSAYTTEAQATTFNVPPTVSLTAPANGANFTAPASIQLTANASDPDGGVAKVEFFQGATKLGEATTAPYTLTWTNVQAGSYTLTARATDTSGATTTSAPVAVTVTLPTVTVAATDASASEQGLDPGTFTVSRAGGTASALTVSYVLSGTAANGTDYSQLPGTVTIPAGSASQTVTVTPVDDGAVEGDESVVLTLSAAAGYQVGSPSAATVTIHDNDINPPTVQLTAPVGGAAFNAPASVTITADAHSDGTISSVEFFQNGTSLGVDTTAPYSITWPNVPEGSYTLTAVATDGRGVSTTSAAVSVSVVDFTAARLDPSNRTGGGVDLLSRNFNWSLPLVGLPGRSGLDLGLSLAYNSLVWTRSGSYVLFDGDGGWPSPGFRLGFPVVQGKFYDSQAGKSAYLMLTPSGARVSLRQTAAGVYEAGDSSYLQLRENQDGSLTVLTTSGTRMSYWPEGGVYKCASVEDSNGNFITAAYDASGNVSAVTDTAGRSLSFNYDAAGYLQSISQAWRREVESAGGTTTQTETHYWARFTYTDETVRTNFAGLTVFGPSNGQAIHALTKVQLSDDSSYTFNYTTWGQVNQVASYSKDGHLLNYTSLNLPADDSQPQTDCPRFTERRDWAAYWNGDADGIPTTTEEAVTAYTAPEAATWANPETGAEEAGILSTETTPDGTTYKEYSHSSGWDKGLARLEEFWSGGVRQKWTSLSWTQDDESLAYLQNPRVVRADIYDSNNNHKRTDISYIFWGLPEDVKEYDADGATVLRRTHTEYLAGSITVGGSYVNPSSNPGLRIVGLPSERDVYAGDQGTPASKLTYEYDLTGEFLTDAGGATQHDSTYGTGFTTRGNLCRVRRWDVTDSLNQSKSIVTSETGYNTLGSPVFTRDALLHKTSVSYTDSDGGARLAYPTTVTDPDNDSSTVEYNYDLGVVTKTTDAKGAATKSFYDAAGRRLKVKSEVNDSYTAWEYGDSGRYVKQFTKVDADKAETFLMSVADGAGRVIGSLREHPGSGTGYAASRSEYDGLGRLVKQFVPLEVSVATDLSDAGSWVPAGDDVKTHGRDDWPYTRQSYDWKGRPTTTTNPDNTQKSVSYDGCGCAGGEVATLADEVGRRQKVYSDALGRRWKTEVLNWDGSVYSISTVKYDALDHAVRARRYAGAAPDPEPDAEGTGYQSTTLAYDGHGRLQSRHLPDQSAGTATAYSYFDDDTVQSVTDARGVKTSFTYNGRHLVTGVTYDRQGLDSVQTEKPGGGGTTPVTDTAAVGFTYDEAGNRLTMTDGSGSTTYHYNTMSRLTSEDRQFAGLTGTYTLSYQYTTAGALKQVTDVTAGVSFSYDIDKVGQATAVNKTESGASAQLAHDMQYRASGALKAMSYGNGTSLSFSYDARGLVSHYGVGGVTQDGQYGALAHGSDFTYYADGRVKYASDLFTDALVSGNYRLHDRAYSYDHAGRLQEAYSGAEANQFMTGTAAGVEGAFRQSYSYDSFDNPTGRTGRLWTIDDNDSEPYAATGRDTAWEYDPDGRFVSRNEQSPNGLTPYAPLRDSYDAAGRLVQQTQTTTKPNPNPHNTQPVTTTTTKTKTYDGDGLIAREATTGIAGTTFYLRSAVLGGQAVSEYDSSGGRRVTHVSAGGAAVADSWNNTGGAAVVWRHQNPVTGDELDTDSAGVVTSKATVDPAGVNLGDSDPSDGTTSGGGSDGGASQAQMDKMYAQLFPESSGGFRCALNDLYMDCGSMPNVIDNGPAVTPANRRYGGAIQNGLSMPEWAWEQLGQQGWRKFWAVVSGREFFQASPQNTLNNPPFISYGNQYCGIFVQFTGVSTDGVKNGPGEVNYRGERLQGLGFTATAYVFADAGAIGHIGPDEVNPQGTWTIRQEAFYNLVHTKTDGQQDKSHGYEPQDLNKGTPYYASDHVVSWYDHPGLLVKDTKSFSGKYDFIISATNGKQTCSVMFRMEIFYGEHNPWSVKWGSGNFLNH